MCTHHLSSIDSYSLFTNAGFCSIVAEMYPLSAAHRFDTTGAGADADADVFEEAEVEVAAFSANWTPFCGCAGILDNCAMLTPNLCISPFSSLSFLFSAPFLLLKLWCLILPARISAAPSPAANSGSASARLSRELKVVDFLLRPPRLSAFLETRADVVDATRETKDECLMVRLSRLEERKESLVEAFSRKVFWGARGWMEFVMRAWRRAVADGFWGAWDGELLENVGGYRGCFYHFERVSHASDIGCFGEKLVMMKWRMDIKSFGGDAFCAR